MESFTAYVYDTNNNLLASQSCQETEKLETAIICLLETLPIANKGVIYDNALDKVIGSYTRRTIE